MRRLGLIAAALVVAAAAVVVWLTGPARSDGGVAGGGSGGNYLVRAIFDDASFAVTGEDVRIAGANVGTIKSLAVTSSKRAAVTISIGDSRFAPFYANAHCAIRPQSLIGEEYVDCTPGTSSAGALATIAHGPGAGSHYLPVTRTSSPVDTDIVQDISTEPVRQSLTVILDELGTGLAARGSDLNAVIHRANPALGNTDKVIGILARQNRTLARLASSSDAVLGPLARERRQIAGFVANANTTAVSSARRAADISRTFHRLPAFLRQLRPLEADLGTLADQGTPVMRQLGTSAASLGQQFGQLTPFATSARTALINLGRAAQQSQPALVGSEPLAKRLRNAGTQTRPAAASLDRLLASLDRSGGIEQLMGVLYQGTAAGNGFDALGHYVRAEPLTGTCTNYTVTRLSSCSADFPGAKATAARASAAGAPTVSASAGHAPAANAATGHAPAANAATGRDAGIVAQAVKSARSGGAADTAISGLLGYLTGKSK